MKVDSKWGPPDASYLGMVVYFLRRVIAQWQCVLSKTSKAKRFTDACLYDPTYSA
jgi:hypothetical protein